MKQLLYCSVLALAVACPSAKAAQPTDEEQLVRIEHDWQRAWSQGDRATLDSILDDSYVGTTYSGSQRHKIDVVTAPPPPSSAIQLISDIEPKVSGDIAVVTGRGQYRQSRESERIYFQFTDVFVRRNGTWRITASQLSPSGS